MPETPGRDVFSICVHWLISGTSGGQVIEARPMTVLHMNFVECVPLSSALPDGKVLRLDPPYYSI